MICGKKVKEQQGLIGKNPYFRTKKPCLEICKMFLQLGIDMDATDREKLLEESMYRAITQNDQDYVDSLLPKYIRYSQILKDGERYLKEMFVTSMYSSSDMFVHLLEKVGINSFKSFYSEKLVLAAANYGEKPRLKFLLEMIKKNGIELKLKYKDIGYGADEWSPDISEIMEKYFS